VSLIDGLDAAGIVIQPVTISATGNKWPDYFVCNPYVLRLTYYSNASDNVRYHAESNREYDFFRNGSRRQASIDHTCGGSTGGSSIDEICSDGLCFFN
jgi:hypothetical protein